MFANRERQLTPEHTPLKVKGTVGGANDSFISGHNDGFGLDSNRNSTLVNGSQEDENENYLLQNQNHRSYSLKVKNKLGKQDYNNKRKDSDFMNSGIGDFDKNSQGSKA